VGNVYIILKQIYSGSGTPYFIRITRVFVRDITKNVLVSFSLAHCVYFYCTAWNADVV